MQQAARREFFLHALEQNGGQFKFLWRVRRVIPLRAFHVIDGNERRLTAHRQAHIVIQELAINLISQSDHLLPLCFVEGLGDTRVLVDTRDGHRKIERCFTHVGESRDRCGRRWNGGTGQRNVAFARQQARRRIEADPARARQVSFAPCVQVGEIAVSAGRTVERFLVGSQLDQIAGGKARGDTEMAKNLHQQPAGIAAGPLRALKRVLGRLHARLHADQIGNIGLQLCIQRHQKIDGVDWFAKKRGARGGQPVGQQRAARLDFKVGREFALVVVGIGERKLLGIRLHEEIERVDDRHVSDQINLNT